MKSISASIVTFAGTLTVALGGMVPHADTQTFVIIVGLIVAAAGLFGWFNMLRSPDP
ncbi:MAG: hypothetical protein JNG89_08155 [Planctomycetaceae bacterium]|nr:hypothetical protein [Planctomycetaceae bacterium]